MNKFKLSLIFGLIFLATVHHTDYCMHSTNVDTESEYYDESLESISSEEDFDFNEITFGEKSDITSEKFIDEKTYNEPIAPRKITGMRKRKVVPFEEIAIFANKSKRINIPKKQKLNTEKNCKTTVINSIIGKPSSKLKKTKMLNKHNNNNLNKEQIEQIFNKNTHKGQTRGKLPNYYRPEGTMHALSWNMNNDDN